ncbi:Redoxin [Jaminaea rosea]|uniref:Redoxin n=1 Tax=Jaminaea rosea TaxID=1569628 RepID=A0A316UYS5_9BASI|nr:Redoxin [Jaminaea rosea]PWN29938.1 Redoxin [Jaminaea rosea]
MASLVDKIANKVKDMQPAIKNGAELPAGHLLKENNPEQGSVDLGKLSGKNIIVGVPGAFTPPCSSHVPGYVSDVEKFQQKGIKDIYVVAVNDQFTVQAWKDKLGSKNDHVHFLADDTAAFTHAVGLGFDASGLLGGYRSQRYVAVVENNKVTALFVEQAPPDVKLTSSDAVLQALNA